ncbi:MAG TPA: hypothetical protein VFX66_01025, partial [Sulfuricurvum sp.]|nr:hypothetical protein [Sulfuricurvum sp.]
MSKIETFEDLQKLGLSILHEQTHIARNKLEMVLTKSFDELTRVQFMGFVSILEREYGIDLSSLREEYDNFMQSHPSTSIVKESVILQVKSRSRQKWVLGGIVAITALIALGWIMQGQLSVSPSEEIIKLSSTDVEVADQNLDVVLPVEINTTVAAPITEVAVPMPKDEVNVSMAPVVNVENAMSIKPLAKVWIGMMDLTSGVKTQKITTEPLILDSSKNTLYMFGHGRLEITTPQGKKMLKERNTVWFTYENGKLQQINQE